MLNPPATKPDWDERTSAPELFLKHSDAVFDSLFERSADAIWLFEVRDPQTLVLVDCNQAAVELIGAETKQQLLNARPDQLSPPVQPDGASSAARQRRSLSSSKGRRGIASNG